MVIHQLVFDGTSRLGKVFAIVIWFINSEWKVQQKLIRLQVLSKSLSGNEISCELIKILPYKYDIRSEQLVAIVHDCTSTNNVAIHTIKVFSLNIKYWVFSHTLNE